MTAPKPLRSLYGASDRQNATKRALTGTGERPQTVLTPAALLQPLLSVWGEIALDPCAHADSPVPALEKWFGTDVREPGETKPRWEGRGLIDPWADRTFVNPPFNELEDWLRCALAERCCGRSAVLAPVRTHRKWFVQVLHAADAAVWLWPVKFVGFDQAFPAPLCLLLWGHDAEAVAEAYELAGLGAAA